MTREAITTVDRGGRGNTHAPPRPVYPTASIVLSRGHLCRLWGKTSLLCDVEGRLGRTDAAVVASEQHSRRPLSRKRRSTALNPAALPAAALRMGSLNHVIGRGGALVACSADGRDLLVRRRCFGHGRGVKFKCYNSN